jgi:hypothetical protein
MSAPLWVKGQSGNPHGRPHSPEIQKFRDALAKVENEGEGKSLYEHYVKMAFRDKYVLVDLMRKLLPDLSMHDIKDLTDESQNERIRNFAARLIVNGGVRVIEPCGKNSSIAGGV